VQLELNNRRNKANKVNIHKVAKLKDERDERWMQSLFISYEPPKLQNTLYKKLLEFAC
jgi:hypothetical protein